MDLSSTKRSISVIIPVYNDVQNLGLCLNAFSTSTLKPDEIIVVDDHSSDGSGQEAEKSAGVSVIRVPDGNHGPAHARNLGVRNSSGELLFFIDSDVRIHSDTIEKMAAAFAAHPDISALFGSYDDAPFHRGLVSRFKNLLHHYVHQNSNEATSTFWTGCGGVKKAVFESLHGFDENFRAIEDIEFGARLRERGFKIMLCKHVLVTHLKLWTFFKWLRCDITARAVPWTRLLLGRKKIPNDLNLKMSSRLSALFAWLAVAGVPAMAWQPLAGLAAVPCVVIIAALNLKLWRFFYAKGGPLFLIGCFFLYGFYLLYSSLIFVLLWFETLLRGVMRTGKKVQKQ